MRHVAAVGMRAKARHAALLQPVPQPAHRLLGSSVEKQADGQGHRSAVEVDRVVNDLLDLR